MSNQREMLMSNEVHSTVDTIAPERGVVIRRPAGLHALAVVFDDAGSSAAGTALADALSAAGVGSITVTHRADAPEAHELSAWAREICGTPWAPVLFGAVGGQAPAILRQARRTGGTAVVAMNAAGLGLVPAAVRASSPALFLVDGDLFGRRFVSRLAAAGAGARGTFAVLEAGADRVVDQWLTSTLLAGPVRRRSKVAPVVAAGALAAAPLLASNPFASAVSVGADAIRGDSSGSVSSAAADDGDLPGVPVDPGAVRGDGHVAPLATGSFAMIDANGMEWFINTDITFGTTSSASGAASEASFTAAVPATTLNGGTVATTLNDSFDGYQSLFVDTDATLDLLGTPPSTLNADDGYNQLGPATIDPDCGGREVLLPEMTTPEGLTVQRSVYIPDDDGFARWVSRVSNPTASDVVADIATANNLGSDSNTTIVTSSSGDTVVDVTDVWATTFQNYSGTTSSDPRLAHVFGGPGAPVPIAAASFANGDDNPFWRYRPTVAAGETVTIVNFTASLPSKAEAQDSAEYLADLPATGLRCLTASELHSIVNFALPVADIDDVVVDGIAGTATVTLSRTGDLDAAGDAVVVLTADTGTGTDVPWAGPFVATFATGSSTATLVVPLATNPLPSGARAVHAFIDDTDGFLAEVAAPAPSATAQLGAPDFIPVPSSRVYDSRNGAPLGPTGTVSVLLTGASGVPADARAVVLNLTSTRATAPSFLTVYPSGASRPLASSLNTEPGIDVPNLVVTKVGPDGRIVIYNEAGSTDVVVDVIGYVPANANYQPVVPVRALDTRTGTGASGPVAAGQQIDVRVTGLGAGSGVPSTGVSAVLLNLTSTASTGPSFVTVWPTGSPRPATSSLNTEPGQDVPNLVLARVDANGRISLYNNAGSTHLVADVVGYFTDSRLNAVNHLRAVDTRAGTGSVVAPLGAGETRSFLISGAGAPLPAGVGSVLINVTTTNSTAPSFVTVWGSGRTQPVTSNLNTEPGQDVPNLVLAEVGADGRINVFNNAGTTDIVIDIEGWLPAS